MSYFSGSVGVSIQSSGQQSSAGLYFGNCSSITSCGTLVTNGDRVPIVGGVAKFQELQIRRAGTNYILQYIGYDSTGRAFGAASSFPFDVYVGPPYMMSFNVTVGRATGGLPFAPNPVVAIVDRGNNLVSNVSSHNVSVSLVQASGGMILEPLNGTTTTFLGGLASFTGLFIQLAGGPIKLRFTTNYVNSSTLYQAKLLIYLASTSSQFGLR